VSLLPFSNYVSGWSDERLQADVLLFTVAMPALFAIAVAVLALRRVTPSLVLLVANTVVFVGMTAPALLADYLGAGRISMGVPISFLVALPAVRRSRARALVWLPISLWLLPWPFVGEIAKPT
jgi:hypothetical protein